VVELVDTISLNVIAHFGRTGSIPVCGTNARLMEMVDIVVLEAMAERRGGSSPSSGTISRCSSVRSECLIWGQEAASSNLAT
jgi:hypothetical protein